MINSRRPNDVFLTLNRIQKVTKIRTLFCKIISDGTARELRNFYRWFKEDLENSLWPVLKGPFNNSVPIDPVSSNITLNNNILIKPCFRKN